MKETRHASGLSRRDFLKTGAAAAAAAGLGGLSVFPLRAAPKRKVGKVIILGMDGLDHGLFSRWLGEGKLPVFSKFVEGGGFRPLLSSIPPQSPVAWSNFITGMGPGGHGIFDFIHRDPKTYVPVFSASSSTPAKHTVRIGKTVFPLSGGQVKNLRLGRAFWQVLEDHDIPATIFKIPSNYPPVPSRQRTISGMNTPDLKGSYGIFNYYTDEPRGLIQEAGGGGRVHDVYVVGNRVEARLPGPTNAFVVGSPEAEVDFRVFIDPVNPAAKISIQGNEFILREKEWSGWVRVKFDLIPTQSVSGICLFYLKEVRPRFKLYVSPIHIDPARPALPISTPEAYSRELERRFGPFFTKGLPADTSALDNGVLDEQEFLDLDGRVLDESLAMLEYELSRFEEGLLFFYFSSTDQRQHMFWRLTDSRHPGHDAALAGKYGDVIERTYREMDRALDMVLTRRGRDTTVIVMSDHGFNAFSRGFNLNTWLLENGYHRLRRPWKQAESELFDNTDWSRTKAYGIGLNGLYINEKGREAEGVVAPGPEKEALVREIVRKLEDFTDPKTGLKVVNRAFISSEVFRGAGLERAPDIVLGFNTGYRISWQSPLGGFPRDIVEDNSQKWSGDHMADPALIPGVVAANRPIRAAFPSLCDLTASVFDLFGVSRPDDVTGRSVFRQGEEG
jgi:predicted AlkP superfamily phosphohydrolase/phosphomutase